MEKEAKALYTVREVSRMTGVSVRTLHYYDQKGLLRPDRSEAGYRLYGAQALSRLQQLLFFRELDFTLAQIKQFLDGAAYDREEILTRQKALLTLRRERLDRLIALIDDNLRGDARMDFDAFDRSEIERAKEEYSREARERWGGTDAYQESERRAGAYTTGDWARISAQQEEIFSSFSALIGTDPAAAPAQAAVARWQAFISENFYPCTDEILAGLGQMYVSDERFQKNLDRRAEGLASFMSRAIAARGA